MKILFYRPERLLNMEKLENVFTEISSNHEGRFNQHFPGIATSKNDFTEILSNPSNQWISIFGVEPLFCDILTNFTKYFYTCTSYLSLSVPNTCAFNSKHLVSLHKTSTKSTESFSRNFFAHQVEIGIFDGRTLTGLLWESVANCFRRKNFFPIFWLKMICLFMKSAKKSSRVDISASILRKRIFR